MYYKSSFFSFSYCFYVINKKKIYQAMFKTASYVRPGYLEGNVKETMLANLTILLLKDIFFVWIL